MYFSKLVVKEGVEPKQLSRFQQKDGYRMHQWLWKLFPEDKSAQRDFLFHRFETPGGPLPFGYYILSNRPPEDGGGLWDLSVKPYAPQLKEGMRLRFSLRANCTIKAPQRDRNKTQGKREDLLMYHKHIWRENESAKPEGERLPFPQREKEQELGLNWLAGRGESSGYQLLCEQSKVVAYRQESFYGKASKPIKFSYFDFEGLLNVTDPEKFAFCLANGLGKSKGFGCGLLLVAPA